jgi:ABC-type Fe3+/spermidine/putrescine transport system ATPase subunit
MSIAAQSTRSWPISSVRPICCRPALWGSSDRLDLEVLGRPLSVPSAHGVYRVGESATLLVRPEAILLLERGSEGYPGRVRRTAYLGPLMEYDVDVAWRSA